MLHGKCMRCHSLVCRNVNSCTVLPFQEFSVYECFIEYVVLVDTLKVSRISHLSLLLYFISLFLLLFFMYFVVFVLLSFFIFFHVFFSYFFTSLLFHPPTPWPLNYFYHYICCYLILMLFYFTSH